MCYERTEQYREWKSIIVREHFCSVCTNAVLGTRGCDKRVLDPPYALATAQHSLAHQVDI